MRAKICLRCKIEKNIDEFYKRENGTKIRAECKECSKERDKKHYHENKEEIFIRHKSYYRENENYFLEYGKNWRRKNKQKISDYHKERRKRKEIRIKDNVSRSISLAIKNNGGKKGGSILNHLPYTIQRLKEHLESQFQPWMNWSNYGGKSDKKEKTWWIDHIVPQSKLLYDSMEHPNFLKCWSLKNLRPLEKIENIKKKDKLITLIMKEQEK